MRTSVRKRLGLKSNETVKIPPGSLLVREWRIRARARLKVKQGMEIAQAAAEAIEEIETELEGQSPFPSVDGLSPDQLRDRIRQIRGEKRISKDRRHP